jgi:hypothetical protein
MPRIVAMLVAALGLATSPALSADYVDGPNGFRLTIPDGWRTIPVSQQIDLLMMSPRYEVSAGACLVMSEEAADTRDESQEKINEALQSEITEAFWQAFATEAKMSEFELVESGSELKDGRRIFFAVGRFSAALQGVATKGQFRVTLHAIPGQTGLNYCVTRLDQVALEEGDIRIIMDSFTPVRPYVIAAPPPRSSTATLVLYSGPRFDGPRRELTRDIPNMALVGWTGATASLSIRGYGLWEICDRIDYRGNCRVVAGAESASMSDRALRIGSARRLVDARDPRQALGVLPEMAATAARQGMLPLIGRR